MKKLLYILIGLLAVPFTASADNNTIGETSALSNLGSFIKTLPVPANIQDIGKNCTDLVESAKQLKAKLENMASSEKLEETGKKALDSGKGKLEALLNLLDGPEGVTVDKLKEAVSSIKTIKDDIKDLGDDELGGLKQDVTDFIDLAQDTYQRIKDVFRDGVYYTTPIEIGKDFKEWSFNLRLDNYRMVQGENQQDTDDDFTNIDASVELQLPFLCKNNNGDVVKFQGEHIKIKGGPNQTSRIALASNPTFKLTDGIYMSFLKGIPDAVKGKIQCAQGDSTWVDFNCHGVTGFSLIASVSFDNKVFIPATPKKENAGNGGSETEDNKDTNAAAAANTNTTPAAATPAANTAAAPQGENGQGQTAEAGAEKKTPSAPAEKDSVRAYFVITAEGGPIARVCFDSPFKIQGCGDFIFTVQDAVIDLSSVRNSPAFDFPTKDYWEEGLAKEAWTGFFLEQLSVQFPDDFALNKNQENGESKITVSKVLIDNHGFSGKVLVENLINTYKGESKKEEEKKTGLQFAIDTMQMVFLKNRPIDGLLVGRAQVDFLKKSKQTKEDGSTVVTEENDAVGFGLRGSVGYNSAMDKFLYDVKVSTTTDNTYDVPFTDKAHIDVNKGSYLEVFNNESTNFAATLNMSGKLTVDWKLKLKGVAFEGLQFSSVKPYVDCKSLSLIGDAKMEFGCMGLELKRLGWIGSANATKALNESGKFIELDDAVGLDLSAQISIIPGDNSLAVTMGGEIYAGHGKKAKDDKNRWRFGRVKINEICIKSDFSVFAFDGCIHRFDDDPTWGDGFDGSLELSLKPISLSIKGQALFGDVQKDPNEKRIHYWLAKADVEFPPTMIFPPCFYLKSAMGGAYQHLGRKGGVPLYNKETGLVNWPMVEINSSTMEPDASKGMGFMLGIGFYVAQKDLLTGNIMLDLGFTPKWGLDHITLSGKANLLAEMPFKKAPALDLLSKVTPDVNALNDLAANGKAEAAVSGNIIADYNVPDKTFFAGSQLKADIAGVIKGDAYSALYIGPDNWYMWLGTRDRPVTLSVLDKLFKARTYFMLGEVPSTLIPLDEELAAQFDIFKVDQSSVGGAEGVAKGRGFAFGANVKVDAQVKLPLEVIWANFFASAGTDLMVNSNIKCNGQKMKWRAQGDAYATLGAAVGATIPLIFKKLKFNIFRGGACALLVGKLPAPIYASADISFNCKILFIKLPHVTIGIKLGKDCN